MEVRDGGRGRGRSRLVGSFCAAILLLGAALGADPSAAATARRKRPVAKKPGQRGKAGIKLTRRFDPKKKPLTTGPLVRIMHYQHVSQAQYRELRNASIALLRRYDPSTHFFVGTGRDPAPIIAFLQNLGGKDLAINFPAGGGLPGMRGSGSQATWLGANAEEIARYLNKLIPSHVPQSGRTIVLLDVTNSGKTPRSFAPQVTKWLKKERSRSKVIKLAFTKFNMPKGVEKIDTKAFPGVDKYMWSPYENVVNEYERHQIGRQRMRTLKPRPQFAKYREAVLQRMERDSKLDAFLQTLKVSAEQLDGPWRPRLREIEKVARLRKAALFSLEVELASPRPDGHRYLGRAHYDYLSRADYDQFMAGTRRLLKLAPPERSFYVGLGSSSTPIVALLDGLARNLATYLPLDDLSQNARRIAEGAPFNNRRRNRFFRVLDAFMPREVLEGKRQVVLFRHSRSGSGRASKLAEQLVSEWMKKNGVKKPAIVSAVFSRKRQPKGIHQLDASRKPELDALGSAKYAVLAPYHLFSAGNRLVADRGGDREGQPLANEAAHDQLKAGLKQRMGNDPTLPEMQAQLQRRIDRQQQKP
jgi:hypothetical protein